MSLAGRTRHPSAAERLERRTLFATLTVTTTADDGPGSLRQAILDANASPGRDSVEFRLPSPIWTVRPASPLPPVTDPLVIDTGRLEEPRPWRVLDGAGAGAGAAGLVLAPGSAGSVVRGLGVRNFGGPGVVVSAPDVWVGDMVIEANGGRPASADPADAAGIRVTGPAARVTNSQIGSNAGPGVSIDGAAATASHLRINSIHRNGSHGVAVTGGASGALIGGPVRATGAEPIGYNQFFDNAGAGVYVEGPGPTAVSVLGNLFFNNRAGGVTLRDADNNTVGNGNPLYGNRLGRNGGADVTVLGAAGGNTILSNEFEVSGVPAIDLGGDGPTPNDALDADSGPNGLQNHPVITSARNEGPEAIVEAAVHSTPNTRVWVEFYYESLPDPDRPRERLPFPTGTLVTTDAAGNATARGVAGTALPHARVTATATALPPDGATPPRPPASTSEFAPPVRVESPVAAWRVYLNGSQWSPAFRAYQLPGRVGATGYGFDVADFDAMRQPTPRPLPWVNVDEVSVRFTEAARVRSADLRVRDGRGEVPVADFSYDPETHVATWRLARPVASGRLTLTLASATPSGAPGGVAAEDDGAPLDGEWYEEGGPSDGFPSGDGTPGGDFEIAVNVRHGDVSGDGNVNALDVAAVKQWLGRSTDRPGTLLSRYTVFHDLDGSGRIDALDLAAVKRSLSGPAPASSAEGVAADRVASITAALFGERRVL